MKLILPWIVSPTPLTVFSSDRFETFVSCYEDVHVVWINLLEYFVTFSTLWTFFSLNMYHLWVQPLLQFCNDRFETVFEVIFHPQYTNSGYHLWAQHLLQFLPIVFWKRCLCFLHEMRMCMWLDIIVRFFSLFFHIMNLVIFSPTIYRQWVLLVSATALAVLYRSFWNFAYAFFMA